MRRLVLALLVLALTGAAAAEAATLDPRELVLRRSDLSAVPWLPSAANGYRTVDQATQGAPPGTAARFAAYGFRRGYDARFGAETALVGSSAYVFGTATGAKRAFATYKASAPVGTKAIRFTRVGDASTSFRSIAKPRLTVIVWLNGPVLSIVVAGGLTDGSTLSLVRTQSRRTVAALGR